VKPTLKELECLNLFRGEHESKFIINNVRFNNRSEVIQREISRLNEKIMEEISDHVDLQHSDFIDHENDEFMNGHEDSVGLYTWMKEQLLKKLEANLKLQEKIIKQYTSEAKIFYFMHQCGARQLNLEDPEELDLTWFYQVKPSAGDEINQSRMEMNAEETKWNNLDKKTKNKLKLMNKLIEVQCEGIMMRRERTRLIRSWWEINNVLKSKVYAYLNKAGEVKDNYDDLKVMHTVTPVSKDEIKKNII